MEFMTEPLPETDSGAISLRALDYGRLDRLIEGKSVLAIGPGIGGAPETGELVRTVVDRYDLPIVLDADGLNAFAGCMDSFHTAGRTRVLTPHPGEMARLTGLSTKEIQADRLRIAREFAASRQAYLVLKGNRTLTAAPNGDLWCAMDDGNVVRVTPDGKLTRYLTGGQIEPKGLTFDGQGNLWITDWTAGAVIKLLK